MKMSGQQTYTIANRPLKSNQTHRVTSTITSTPACAIAGPNVEPTSRRTAGGFFFFFFPLVSGAVWIVPGGMDECMSKKRAVSLVLFVQKRKG